MGKISGAYGCSFKSSKTKYLWKMEIGKIDNDSGNALARILFGDSYMHS